MRRRRPGTKVPPRFCPMSPAHRVRPTRNPRTGADMPHAPTGSETSARAQLPAAAETPAPAAPGTVIGTEGNTVTAQERAQAKEQLVLGITPVEHPDPRMA